MKRKYNRYEVATNIPGEEGTFHNYREAFARYAHIRTYGRDAKATLWGINKMGEYNCILSF